MIFLPISLFHPLSLKFVRQLLQQSLMKWILLFTSYTWFCNSFMFYFARMESKYGKELNILRYCNLWYSTQFSTHLDSPVCLFNNGYIVLKLSQYYFALIGCFCFCYNKPDILLSHMQTHTVWYIYIHAFSIVL